MVQKRKIKSQAINWDSIEKVMLIRLRSMGDIILMSPVITSLKKWKPELFLSILIEARFKALVEGNPLINSIIFDKTGSGGKRTFSDQRLILGKLAQQNFDMVINLHGGTRSTLQTISSQATYRVSPDYFRYGFIYNIRTPSPQIVWQTNNALHTVQNQLSLLKGLNIPIADFELSVPRKNDVQQDVVKQLASLGIDSKIPYIIIHPGGSLPSKRWNPGKFAQLSDWLINTYKIPVLIVTGEQEEAIMDEILSKVKYTPFFWPAPKLDKLIAIINNCSLYIGNDAGPTHLASAFKKPIVVIFGSSNHTQWHPWGTNYSLIRKELPCSPCPGKKCNHNVLLECIRSITLEEVQKGVQEQITHI